MTDGQLRMWIRAAKREEAWAPRYVGNELAGTRQAATAHRSTAELRTAEADAATDPAERARLQTEANQARALAETLDDQVAKLQVIDDARAMFLADNARTLGYGRRCEAELTRRHIDDTAPEQLVTADEWLAADRAAAFADDQYRDITAVDLADSTSEAHDDRVDVTTADETVARRLEVPDRDIRQVAADEPSPVNEDVVRVPSPDETADHYSQATRSLAEIQARRAIDEQEEAEHRAAELGRWHNDDQAAAAADHVGDAHEPADYDDASTATATS